MPEVSGAYRVPVRVAKPYDVLVGTGLLAQIPELISAQQVALVSDENVASLHAVRLHEELIRHGAQVELLIIEPGEASKNLHTLSSLLEQLARAAFDRDCVVIGLGGGVVTDLAGFLAASYLRGVSFCSVPTSLLGMVDAGVGGKTAVNLQAGKNLVGAFWQPQLVLADVGLLKTLPERQFRLGAVEFFKHALLGRPEQLSLLNADGFSAAAGDADLSAWLRDNISVKAEVVARDERESGERAFLNLGHTLGHALEGASEHRLEHGEAVAYGILYACLLGRSRGMEDLTPIAMQLLRYVQPAQLGPIALPELLPFMARDKKNRAGVQRFVLLERPGSPLLVDDLTSSELEAAWLELRRLVEGLDWGASN